MLELFAFRNGHEWEHVCLLQQHHLSGRHVAGIFSTCNDQYLTTFI